MPTAERGEQVRPTATSAGTTRPRRPMRSAATGSLACVTELPKFSSERQLRKKEERVDAQHWTGPVLQELEMPEGWLLRAATHIMSVGINKSDGEVKLTTNGRSATRRGQRRQASGEALRVRFRRPCVNCSGACEDSEYSGEFHDA